MFTLSTMAAFLLSYVFYISVVLSQCGYYLLEPNNPYIMDTCQSNVPKTSLRPATSYSSMYSCSSDNTVVIHKLWRNSSICNGEAEEPRSIQCIPPKCYCTRFGHTNCEIWSYKKNNCIDNKVLETATVMVNQCFNSKYKNICYQDGQINSIIYENDGCTGNRMSEQSLHIINENETCVNYYCDEEPQYESPNPVLTNTTIISNDKTLESHKWSWVLPVIASLMVIASIVYCWMLKAPNKEDTESKWNLTST